MSLDAAFGASRFLHFLGVLWLFGTALYPLAAGHAVFTQHAAVVRRLRASLFLAALLALAGGALWFVFAVAQMADGLASLADAATWQTVFSATDFGPLWAVRLALIGPILLLLRRWPGAYARSLVSALSALVLASLAGTGHTRTTEGFLGGLHIAADALHLIAAGAWLGGLVALAILVARGGRNEQEHALVRFSGYGTAAVATLVATGIINGLFLVGTVEGLVATRYGQLLLLKLALFAGMLAHAGLNRFRLVPALLHEGRGGASGTALSKLRRNILVEQLLGIAVIAIVSILGTLEPPAGN